MLLFYKTILESTEKSKSVIAILSKENIPLKDLCMQNSVFAHSDMHSKLSSSLRDFLTKYST